ncbi:protein phosphatase 2C domain-containing protein [Asanoa ishikariensis]|nr:protein phosphatase 2C domain-containing protein [Asanoa ishikariensis]
MRVAMATAAAEPGRVNEDFFAAGPTAAVLLDGAGIRGIEEICRHGVAWYTTRLGGELVARLALADGRDLVSLLSEAIDAVASSHRDTCDLTDPSSPSATVAILRLTGDRADHLVLGDSVLVLDRGDAGLAVVHDRRELVVRERFGSAYEAAPEGSAEKDRERERYVTALRANRNQPGGFWLAKDDPAAAAEAIIGSEPILDLTDATLLTNGASRLVDRFGAADWPSALAIVRAHGPAEIIRRVRATEQAGGIARDDATVAHCAGLAD